MRAMLFDFDGLLVDSEWANLVAWQEAYASHHRTLDLARWHQDIGSGEGHDWAEALRRAVGTGFDADRTQAARRRRRDELCCVLPGVADLLAAATGAGVRTGIVSNSPREWIERICARTGLDPEGFDVIVDLDGTRPPKPDPAPYLHALERLGVEAAEAIAFEDSPRGIDAAKAAGIYCVAVPNRVTVQLDLSAADRIITEATHFRLEPGRPVG